MSQEFNPDGPFWTTEFINKTEKNWNIREHGQFIAAVPPGMTIEILSWKATTQWSRYSRVVADKTKGIVLTLNPDWKTPYKDSYLLEVENVDGAPTENIQVSDVWYHVERGMPELIPVNIFDDLIKWAKIRWVNRIVHRPIAGTKYFENVEELFRERIPRDDREMRKIYKERTELRKARVEAEERAKLFGDRKEAA